MMKIGTNEAYEHLWAAIRFGVLLVMIFGLPKLVIKFMGSARSCGAVDNERFKLGLENISDDFLLMLTPKENLSYAVALVTNHTGKDQIGHRNIDILLQRGLTIKKIFAPQHGFDGDISVDAVASDRLDPVTRIPIVNLHGRQLTAADVRDVDVIFFDLQDIGIRYYSYVNTLVNVMEVSACCDKSVVVLDRPNLLGDAIEGAFGLPEMHNSLLSMNVPIRYGLTIGELAQYCNKYVIKKTAKLFVVPMDNYNRHMHHYKSPIGKLSPNISSRESCYGYSFLGLIGEIHPFDIGIGTDKAFQCILLPEHVAFSKKQWFKLRDQLHQLGIDSAYYRYFSHRKKEFCSGLRVNILDISNFSLFKALVATLEFFKAEGIDLKFSEQFCKIPGMYKIKQLVEGSMKKEEFESEIKQALDNYFIMAASSFIYKPYPKIIVV